MSLISVHRSPTPTDVDDCIGSECTNSTDDLLTTSSGTKSRSLSECYFTVRGAAVILSHSDEASVSPRSSGNNEIEEHLQGMLRILRPDDILSMAVRIQCSSENRAKYLAVISTYSFGPFVAKNSTITLPDQIMLKERISQEDLVNECHEVALIGFDVLSMGKILIGAIIPIQRSIRVELDGDGGIVVADSASSYYLFKPVSIQSMWSLFQCLHREIALAVQRIKPPSPIASTSAGSYLRNSHLWLNYYESLASKDDLIRAQWHYCIMDDAMKDDFKASSRTASSTLVADSTSSLNSFADSLPTSSSLFTDSLLPEMSRLEAEQRICNNLKYIMQSIDLDTVTSRDIRQRLEERLSHDLCGYKEFIDRSMLVILGQLDKPSKIFDYLYLGTEWNASNWEELKLNRVNYILNVTKEVDNFFPTQFKYLKIWVSDEANTELLRHWQRTYDFIKEAKEKGGVVLVHCKKGISRSSSTVIAYIMKEYGWSLENSLNHVKKKRDCITPNSGFMQQLQTFYGVLKASSNRHSSIFNTSKKTVTPSNWVMPARSRSKISVSAQL